MSSLYNGFVSNSTKTNILPKSNRVSSFNSNNNSNNSSNNYKNKSKQKNKSSLNTNATKLYDGDVTPLKRTIISKTSNNNYDIINMNNNSVVNKSSSKSFNKALSSIKNCVSSNKNTINYIFNIKGGPRGPRGLPCESEESSGNFIDKDIVNKSATADCNGHFINQHLTTTSGVTFNTVTVTNAYLLDGVSVTAEQWQHVASLDQSVSTTADVQFNTVNGTNISQNTADDLNTINNLGLTGLTTDEVNQLKNIDNTTISSTQWGYLGNLDQNISTTSDVEFNRIDVTSKLNIGPTGSIPEQLITCEFDPNNQANMNITSQNTNNDTISSISTVSTRQGALGLNHIDFSVPGTTFSCEYIVNEYTGNDLLFGFVEECYTMLDYSGFPNNFFHILVNTRTGTNTDWFLRKDKTTGQNYIQNINSEYNINSNGPTGVGYRINVLQDRRVTLDFYDGTSWINTINTFNSNILNTEKIYKIIVIDQNTNSSSIGVTINGSYYRPSIPITEGELTVNGISRIYGDIYLDNLLPDKNIVIDSNRQLTTEEKESFIDSSNITWTSSTTGRQFTANTVQNISTTADVQFAKITIDDLVIATSYTPTSTNDTNGDIGALTWDDDYIYVKTNEGWKKAGITSI